MMILIKISLIIVIFLFMLYIFNLVRQKRMKVEYSIYWLITGMVMLLFGLFNKILVRIGRLTNLSEMLIMIVLILIILLMFIIIKLTIGLSKVETSVKELTQDVSLIKYEEELKNKEK